jgi:uncharacterized membrane protein
VGRLLIARTTKEETMALAYGLLVLVGLIAAVIVVLAVPALIGYMAYETIKSSNERRAEETATETEAAPSTELQELSVA